jgi:signal transduction histidine kinase
MFGEQSRDAVLVDALVLLFTIVFGYFLIRSVRSEVKHRQQIEKLAQNLEKANDRLKELDKQKTEFVSLASHQLRAPLTALKGYASLLLEGSFGALTPDVASAVAKMGESSRNMAYTVEDFLNVSRIELGIMKYSKEPFDFCSMVTDITKDLGIVASAKNLKVALTCPTEKAIVNGDANKIKQVLSNLIDNAIKYTPQGDVRVKLEITQNHTARFSVTDTGVGIPSESIGKLFDKFVRGKNAQSANTQGTGLGLYVAKQFVEAHDGKIWAESEGEGKGSTFYVELPLA